MIHNIEILEDKIYDYAKRTKNVQHDIEREKSATGRKLKMFWE